MDYQPHNYQRRATQALLENSHFALWLEMGLGKTVATATAIAELMDAAEVGRCLIVAPLRVATHTWPDELCKWDHLKDIPFRSLRGTERERQWKLCREFTGIDIINYELLTWLCSYLENKRWPWDMVVFDESSKMKSPRSQRWRRARRRVDDFGRAVLLTGSPAPNGLLDIWAPFYLLDGGEALGKTFDAYRNRWFYADDWQGYNYRPYASAIKKIHERVAPRVLSMKSEDYITLPDRIDNTITLNLPPSCRELYDLFEEQMWIELEKEEVFASNAAGLLNKCLQMSNGAVYTNTEEQKTWTGFHNAKLDALEDIVEESEGQPIIVAYQFRHDAERILTRFKQARHFKTDKDVDAWNAGDISILVGHPLSMGHGLNLQQGGHILVWFGLTWSLEQYVQTNARLHRMGQGHPVMVHHLVMKNTVEQTVVKALQEKRKVQNALMDQMKARLVA